MKHPGDETPKETELPIACELSALDPGQGVRRAELAASVRANVTSVVETPNGYELHLRRDDRVVRQAEELIALERQCCRFLTLSLRRDATTGESVLEVSGEPGAKAFIALEMGILGAP